MATTPYTPDNDQDIVYQLPPGASTAKQLNRTTNTLTPEQAAQRAQEYLNLARYNGDPRYYSYAQAQLAPWWKQAEPPFAIRLPRAIIRQHHHQFTAALTDLNAILNAQPQHLAARLQRAHIALVRADYAQTKRDCQALIRQHRLTANICLSHVHSLTGQLQPARERLQTLLNSIPPTSTSLRHWAHSVLADMATRAGDNARAETHHQAALKLYPEDINTLAQQADLFINTQNYNALHALLNNAPNTEILLLRQIIAQQQQRAPKLAANKQRMEDWFTNTTQRNEPPHWRERARYALDVQNQPCAALKYAQQNWQHQREPDDMRILIRAAQAANQPSAAQPVWQLIDTVGLQDQRLEALRTAP